MFAKEAEEIEAEFVSVWAESGIEHNYQERTYITPFADRSEYLSGLLDDPRIDGVASSILGDDYNYADSDGSYWVGDTNWHSDHYPSDGYKSIRVALYLDPVTKDTGCLRVIPGSCHDGDRFTDSLHKVVPVTRQNRSWEEWGVHGDDVPAYDIESQPGNMLVFNHKTKVLIWCWKVAERTDQYAAYEEQNDEHHARKRCQISHFGVHGFLPRADQIHLCQGTHVSLSSTPLRQARFPLTASLSHWAIPKRCPH